MIVNKIYDYLGGSEQAIDKTILEEAAKQFKWTMERQFMKQSHPSTGKLYPSSLGNKCARQLAFKYYGFPKDDEMRPRNTINFFLGDLAELAMLSLAKLAGLNVEMDTDRLNMEINYKEDLTYNCHGYTDGILHTKDEDFVVECKTKTQYGFKRFEKNGPSNSWGYLSQVNLYLDHFDLDRGIFLVLDKNTGKLAEKIVEKDEKYIEKAKDNIRQVLNGGPNNLPDHWQDLESFHWMGQKKCYDLGKDEEGNSLPFCSYCSFTDSCWGENLETEILKSGPRYRYYPKD